MGFILTMWNVNYAKSAFTSQLPGGFILTMWNVNKGEKGEDGKQGESFILTMRNVNNEKILILNFYLVSVFLLFQIGIKK